MKYKVIEFFTDLQDNDHEYNVGDEFPRAGMAVTTDRIKELSTDANKRGIALIEEVRGTGETEQDNPAPVENEPKKRTRKPRNPKTTE